MERGVMPCMASSTSAPGARIRHLGTPVSVVLVVLLSLALLLRENNYQRELSIPPWSPAHRHSSPARMSAASAPGSYHRAGGGVAFSRAKRGAVQGVSR